MSSYKIVVKNVENESDNFEDISSKLEKHYTTLENIKKNLSGVLGSGYNLINSTLGTVMEQIQQEQKSCLTISKNLEIITQTYVDTERGLISNYTIERLKSEGDNQNGSNFGSYFKDNFWSSLRDSIIEGSGNTVVRVGGLINVITATARSANTTNGFVILNPNIIPTTSKMISIGSKIVTGAKVGLPIIGGIIDYASMRTTGEDRVDAATKATAHVGIGLAGGAAGAKLGTLVGSIVPGPGNVVGAAVGFVVGVAITTVGSVAFDYVYDNWDEVKETAKDVGKTVVRGAEKISKEIGKAISTTGEFWGTVFG